MGPIDFRKFVGSPSHASPKGNASNPEAEVCLLSNVEMITKVYLGTVLAIFLVSLTGFLWTNYSRRLVDQALKSFDSMDVEKTSNIDLDKLERE